MLSFEDRFASRDIKQNIPLLIRLSELENEMKFKLIVNEFSTSQVKPGVID